jgi:hypothetical protein
MGVIVIAMPEWDKIAQRGAICTTGGTAKQHPLIIGSDLECEAALNPE